VVNHFARCTPKQLQGVDRLAERIQVGEGEILTREGRIGRQFFAFCTDEHLHQFAAIAEASMCKRAK
jgi:hypothetical protein